MSDFQTNGVAKALEPYMDFAPTSSVVPFKLPKWAINGRPAAAFAHLPVQSLADGLETNIEEIRSAVSAIPPSAISTEPEWMKLARALAHEAAVFKTQTEELEKILDTASRSAPGYDQEDNHRRFQRYISEALVREDPITIATVFHMALEHGWQGWSPSNTATSNAVVTPVNPHRAVPIANLPLVPPKREWLHGTDLMRNAVSMLSAPGARAKTTWLLTCALACTSGRPLLGAHVFGGPLCVLYLSAEDSTDEIALRLRAAMQHHGLSNADVPGLHVIGVDHWGLSLLHAAAGGAPIIDQGGWGALMAELDQIEPDVLIIDPLINVMGGVDVNNNSAAALLIGQLAALAAKRRISVMIAHHVAKGRDPASAEAAMGAASFVNLCRIALGIEPLAEGEAGRIGLPPWEAKSVFRIVGTKLNYSPPGADDRWYRLLSVEIQNQLPPIYITGDRVAVIEVFHPGSSGPTFPPQLIRDALLALDTADPPLSPSKQSTERYAAPVIAQAIAPHRHGQSSDTEAKAILDHIIRTGLVHVESVKVSRPGGRSDLRNGLVLTPTGKAVVRQENQVASNPPQSPQSPAEPTAGDAGNAGGDLLSGPPHR
jgi:AAA domain/Primase C terminal 2 (PriCT-2)